MSYSDNEIDFLIESRELEGAFLEAKKNQKKDPEAYSEAKQKFHKHRTKWRGIREYLQATGAVNAGDVATPGAIEATSKVKDS